MVLKILGIKIIKKMYVSKIDVFYIYLLMTVQKYFSDNILEINTLHMCHISNEKHEFPHCSFVSVSLL